MILVVEGISASGKSSWCEKYGHEHVIPENGRLDMAPDRASDPAGAARFWAERNVGRWQAALAIEKKSGLAVCDTDPLKLHYLWCLWQIGEAGEGDWLLELAAARKTIQEARIGFADSYIIGQIEPEVARQRAQADMTRRRSRFELHVRLQKPLVEWYSALARALPDRVRFTFPSEMPHLKDHDDRYDLAVFDRMIAGLPGPSNRPA